MAVTFKIEDIIRFSGLSTDTKPLTYAAPGEGDKAVPVGSVFTETDKKGNKSEFDGVGWFQTKVNGAGDVRLPENASGMLSPGEHLSSSANPTNVTVNFANGLNGVTVEYKPMDQSGLPNNVANDAAMEMYVAFNNSIANDVTVPNLRHTVSLGKSKSFTFPGSPKPTQMTLSIPSDGANDPLTKATYTVAEV